MILPLRFVSSGALGHNCRHFNSSIQFSEGTLIWASPKQVLLRALFMPDDALPHAQMGDDVRAYQEGGVSRGEDTSGSVAQLFEGYAGILHSPVGSL